MAASDYVPIFFKNRLHLEGRPQMSTRPISDSTNYADGTTSPFERLALVLGGWEDRYSFPNREAPRLSAGGCERGASPYSSWWLVGREPARYCAPSGTRQMGHDRALARSTT